MAPLLILMVALGFEIRMHINKIMKKISILIPVYFNEINIPVTYSAVLAEINKLSSQFDYEVIFIEDGSGDNSFKELIKIYEQNPKHIKIIKLSRNFGQLAAIQAGFKIANGNALIIMSADLQDPPELINMMLTHYINDNYEIVICTRESRDEPFSRRITSKMFYSLIKKLSFMNMPIGGFDYFLISDKVKKTILDNYEANAFLQGQILWSGFKIKFIPYQRKKREIGVSKWTFGKRIKYLIDGVTSYSYFPLRLMSVVGTLVALVGFLYALFIIFARIFGDVIPYGWAPIMVVVLLLSGIQMLMLGVVGEYLWRVLDQVRNRQPYIIEKIYD